jgi:hypothetical protein
MFAMHRIFFDSLKVKLQIRAEAHQSYIKAVNLARKTEKELDPQNLKYTGPMVRFI